LWKWKARTLYKYFCKKSPKRFFIYNDDDGDEDENDEAIVSVDCERCKGVFRWRGEGCRQANKGVDQYERLKKHDCMG